MRTTGLSHAFFITIRYWIAGWACLAIIRFLKTRKLKQSSRIFTVQEKWRGSWALTLWTLSIVMDIWGTNFSARTPERGMKGEVVRAAGGSTEWRCETDGRHPAAERAISEPYFRWQRLQLLAGFCAARGASGSARRVGGCRRSGPDDFDLSGIVVGR